MRSPIRPFKNLCHYLISVVGPLLYGSPSKKIFVVGITGTKGKTTTVELINAGLEAAGLKTAVSSSVRRKIGDKSEEVVSNSMPGRLYLQKFLRDAVKAKCRFAIIEVTSEGIKQHRHRGIHFDAGIFLNLHPEHIESHGGFEKYRAAKVSFFKYIVAKSKKAVKRFFVNIEDGSARYFIEAGQGGEIFLYLKSRNQSALIGEFNRINVAAAESLLSALSIPEATVQKAFKEFKGVPGRMEEVIAEPFRVVVDYAHTPESLEAVYKTLSNNGKEKLICVLGSAGGGRDKWKRPKMGGIASLYCKKIILTDEDPYDEDPQEIIREIKAGIHGRQAVYAVLDRGEAIKRAINFAGTGDVVVITGKGNEKFIRAKAGKKIPWSDRGASEEVLGRLGLTLCHSPEVEG